MLKIKYAICLSIILILLTGCWDTLNIENRGFVMGMAIDMVDEQNEQGQEEYLITNQIAIPTGLSSNVQSGGSEKAFYNISFTNTSFYKTADKVTGASSKIPFYDHLMILCYSRDVVEQEHVFSKSLDPFIRDVHTRRSIKVIITDGSAKELLAFTSPEQKLPSLHLEQLLDQSHKNAGYLEARELGDIEELHLAGRSYVLPLLTPTDDYVEYVSGAVFQGSEDKMVGTFNEKEMEGLEFLLGDAQAKYFTFDYEGESIAIQDVKQNSDLTIDAQNKNNIHVKLDIHIDGTIKETFKKINFEDPSTFQAVQEAASKEIKDTVNKVIEKGQKEYNADVFRIWRELENSHYDIWKQVKDNWEKGENYFSKVTFDVNVDTEIYSTGTSNRTD